MAEHINTCEEYIDDTTQVNIHDTVEKYLHGPTNFDFNTYRVFSWRRFSQKHLILDVGPLIVYLYVLIHFALNQAT
jgi:hypothetical protein